MDAMQAIFSRRSIRKYTAANVSDPVIEEILKAGMSAPSAGNQQPWHFVVLRDRKLLDAVPSFHPHSKMLAEAQAAVLVCGDESLEKHKGYWVQDCSAAVENMLIALQANGLGAVWLGIYPREDRVAGMRKLLNIPERVIPFALISIGYPGEKKGPEDRYDRTRVHRDKW
jgi:nitroreductase